MGHMRRGGLNAREFSTEFYGLKMGRQIAVINSLYLGFEIFKNSFTVTLHLRLIGGQGGTKLHSCVSIV